MASGLPSATSGPWLCNMAQDLAICPDPKPRRIWRCADTPASFIDTFTRGSLSASPWAVVTPKTCRRPTDSRSASGRAATTLVSSLHWTTLASGRACPCPCCGPGSGRWRRCCQNPRPRSARSSSSPPSSPASRFPDVDRPGQRMGARQQLRPGAGAAGLPVCAPEQRGFGQRVSDQAGWAASAISYLLDWRTLLISTKPRRHAGHQLAAAAGRSPASADARRAIPAAAPRRCGWRRLTPSASRSRAFLRLLLLHYLDLGLPPRECNYVPGIALSLAEMGELAALVNYTSRAPRPMRVNGSSMSVRDPSERAWALHWLQPATAVTAAWRRASTPTGHAMSHDWLRRWL